MFIVKYKWIFLIIGLILMIASIFLIFDKGIKKGIDFTGGTDIVLSYDNLSKN